MKNLFYLKSVLIVSFVLLAQCVFSQLNKWNYLNHESGGYVTEIIPVKYYNQLPSSVNEQVLYARTDVGGLYRSSNNGKSWDVINNYFRKETVNSGLEISDLSIQGIAIKENGDGTETVVIAVGFYPEDLHAVRCIFKSTNSGKDWLNVNTINISSPGILFQGNNFPLKIGGECIIFNPNNLYEMYAGGMNPEGGISYLYKSVNEGRDWNKNLNSVKFFPGIEGECITSINIKEGVPGNIWVGTSHRIVFTTNDGANWNSILVAGENTPYIKRALLKKEGNAISEVLFTWGYYDDNGVEHTGVGKAKAIDGWNY